MGKRKRLGVFEIFFTDGSSIEVFGNLYAIDRGWLFKRSSGEVIAKLNFDHVLYITEKERKKR